MKLTYMIYALFLVMLNVAHNVMEGVVNNDDIPLFNL